MKEGIVLVSPHDETPVAQNSESTDKACGKAAFTPNWRRYQKNGGLSALRRAGSARGGEAAARVDEVALARAAVVTATETVATAVTASEAGQTPTAPIYRQEKNFFFLALSTLNTLLGLR